MGKSIPSTTKLQEFAKIIASDRLPRPKRAKPISRIRVSSPETAKPGAVRVDSERKKIMESSGTQQNRLPLALVVSDCVKRWFQDTLKEAKAGDSAMQVLVGQMYSSGYGVPKDPHKGRGWISKASKSRVSVWNVTMQVTQIRMNQRVKQNKVNCNLLLNLLVKNEFVGCDEFQF